VRVADMVAVHVAEEHGVDLAESWIIRAAHRAADVVEDARAVRVLEDERPIEGAELAVVRAHRCHLHGCTGPAARGRRLRGARAEGHDENHDGIAHGLLLGLASAYY